MQKIAIIGAGITGLTIASKLTPYATVSVFEKSRGLGGRMATRRVDDYHFDHGAQYFVAKTTEFREFLKAPLNAGAIARWDAKFVELDGNAVSKERDWNEKFPHFVGTPTMSALARFIAQGLNIINNVKIASVAPVGGAQWQLRNEFDDVQGVFDWVISTCPVEQTRQVMPANFIHRKSLSEIEMMPCFALMLGFKDDIPLKFQAALVRNSAISWIANNSHKPHRPSNFSMLIQSTNEWAEENVDRDIEEVTRYLIKTTENVLGLSLDNADYIDVHRWLYANTLKKKQNIGDVFVDESNKLAAAGDWCGNARVESAFLHGSTLANKLQTILAKAG